MFGSLNDIIKDSNITNLPLTIKLAYDDSGNLEYVGKALPGSSASEAVWQIQKLEYDGSGNLISVCYAEGTASFDKVWDNRTSYTYR